MKVEQSVVVHAPRQRIWRLVAEPARYPRILEGTTWRSHNGHRGLGARYDVRTRVGSAQVGGQVEVSELEPGYDLAWVSVTGLDQRGRWRLREHPAGGIEVTLRLRYASPGGLLGLLADLTSSALVRARMREWLDHLKTLAEARA
jgi:uncharacterized membrane protein